MVKFSMWTLWTSKKWRLVSKLAIAPILATGYFWYFRCFFSLPILKKSGHRSPFHATSPRSQAAMMREVENPVGEAAVGLWLWTNHLISTKVFWLSKKLLFIHISGSIPINDHHFDQGMKHPIYQLFWCSPGVQSFDTLPFIHIYPHIYTKSLAFFFNPELVIQRTRVLAFRAFQIGKTGEDHYMDLNQLRSNTLSESTHHPLRSLCSGSFGEHLLLQNERKCEWFFSIQ